jgi:transcriptional regulator with XRE-family HTH domain
MHETVAQAYRDLGARLAAMREAAGLTQASLARLVGYSRSTVANAEAGQGAARHFWEMCDDALGGGSGLLCMFGEIKALHHRHQQEAAATVRRQREAESQQWQRGRPGALANAAEGQRQDRSGFPQERPSATRDHQPVNAGRGARRGKRAASAILGIVCPCLGALHGGPVYRP